MFIFLLGLQLVLNILSTLHFNLLKNNKESFSCLSLCLFFFRNCSCQFLFQVHVHNLIRLLVLNSSIFWYYLYICLTSYIMIISFRQYWHVNIIYIWAWIYYYLVLLWKKKYWSIFQYMHLEKGIILSNFRYFWFAKMVLQTKEFEF